VTPERAVIGGTVRAFNDETLALIDRNMRRVANGVASASARPQRSISGSWHYRWSTMRLEAGFIADAAAELVGADNVDRDSSLIMASEDFSYMLDCAPGAYIRIGNGDEPGGCQVHNPGYDFSDAILPLGASLFVRLAERKLAPYLDAVEAGCPPAADLVGDGDWPRQRWHRRRRVGVAGGGAGDHVADLVTFKPASLDELLRVDGDLLGQRLSEEAHHQGRRKRPRLGGEVADAPTMYAGLLADLAADCVLQCLTRFHEPGKAGKSRAGAAAATAEQGTLASDREHDHDRVDARKVMRLAGRAVSRPTTRHRLARRPALRAKAVPRVPIDDRARLGQYCCLGSSDQRRQGADIDVFGHWVGRQVGARRVECEMGSPLGDAQEDEGCPRRDRFPPWADGLPVERHFAAVVDRRLQVS
jgi:peptidase M20/M25/M40-like protein